VLRAPALEYGVNAEKGASYPGRVSLRKKTLHRLMNDMLASWETHGVTEFIILTAHAHDPHQEALATLATVTARVRVVDLFAVNLSDLTGRPKDDHEHSNLYLSLMLYLAPQLVDAQRTGNEGSREHGQALYERIRARISERVFLAPAPTE
jgi:creatinine amidohydrolase